MNNRFFQKINIVEIPYIHPQIDLSDLTDDLKIAEKDKFEIIPYEGKELLLYKELGAGKFGSAYLVQDDEGKFYVLKVQTRDIQKAIAEHHLNKKLQQSPSSPAKKSKKQTENIDSPDKYQFLINIAKGQTIQHLTDSEIDYTVEKEEDNLHIFIPPVLRLQLAIEVLKAIHKLNKQGILHRDLSAENIFINPILQTAEIIDLGLAIKTVNGIAKDKLRGSSITYSQELRDELLKRFNNENNQEIYDPDVIYSKKTEAYAAGILLGVFFHLFLGPEDMDDIKTWESGKTYIVDKEDSVFQYNTALPDSIRADVLAVLQRLTDVESKRMLIPEAIKQLEQIKAHLIKSNDAKIQVSIVDVDDYIHADETAKKRMFDDLQAHANEVWLVDTGHNKLSMKQYIEIQRELEKNTEAKGIKVGNKIFIDTDKKKLEKKINNYLSDKNIRKIPSVCHWEVPERTRNMQPAL